MSTPSPWVAIILAAASYRLWRLMAEDSILERPRRWLCRLPYEWEPPDATPDTYRHRLAEFINCPWCSGFWIAVAVWGIWQLDHKWATILLTPFALSAAVGLIRVKLDPAEE